MISALLTVLLLAGPVLGSENDSIHRLQNDPSAAASLRLSELYVNTKDSDQRFWIIHALGARLKDRGDLAALEMLLTAASKEDPPLRGPALRALAGFSSMREEDLREPLLARLSAVAVSGAGHQHPAVRREADGLKKAIEVWKDPDRAQREAAARKPRTPLWVSIIRPLRWLWVLLLPGLALIWAACGLPVLDSSAPEGRRARAAWAVLKGQKLFLTSAAFLWLCLAGMLAGYGFDLMAILIGTPFYGVPGGWLKVYFAAGFCLFLPGALAAAGLALSPSGALAASSSRSLPRALILSAAIFAALAPMEILYRLLLRSRPKDGEPAGPDAPRTLGWILDTGALRSGFLVASIMACEEVGLMPAFWRGRELFDPETTRRWRLRLSIFDARFALLCAAPVLAFLCAIIARGQPVQWNVSFPIVLIACTVWSWTVLAGVLLAVASTLEGVLAAARYLEAARGALPESLDELVRLDDPQEPS